MRALNLFIDDIYHDQKIAKDGVVPADILHPAGPFRKACVGLNPPCGIRGHITGAGLVCDAGGKFDVLEGNLCCPSGVTDVRENTQVMKRTIPLVFEAARVCPVAECPSPCCSPWSSWRPTRARKPPWGC